MKSIKLFLASMLMIIFSATAASAVVNVYTQPDVSGQLYETADVRQQMLGDINLDNTIDVTDAILLLQHSLFPEIYVIGYVGNIDFTHDGEVDMNDAILVLQHSMFPDLYPLEKEEEPEPEPKVFTVTFYVDGDSYDEQEVLEGAYPVVPADPTLEEGATFAGWSLEQDGNKNDVIDVSGVVIDGPTDFYAVIIRNPNDAELMEKLGRGYKQLLKIRATGLQRDGINLIKECVKLVIDDANGGEYIDKKYVKEHYGNYIEEVRILVNETMTSTERSSFINTITNERNIDKDVQDFLIDYFDIDTTV